MNKVGKCHRLQQCVLEEEKFKNSLTKKKIEGGAGEMTLCKNKLLCYHKDLKSYSHSSCKSLSPMRYFSKQSSASYPPQTVPPMGNRVFKNVSLWGALNHHKHIRINQYSLRNLNLECLSECEMSFNILLLSNFYLACHCNNREELVLISVYKQSLTFTPMPM